MRTALFLAAGFLLLAGFAILGRLFVEGFKEAPTAAILAFVALWLALTGANMWVGVTKAGYSVMAELPIFLLLFAVPAAAAALVKWKLL